jgi:hypothetical protein
MIYVHDVHNQDLRGQSHYTAVKCIDPSITFSIIRHHAINMIKPQGSCIKTDVLAQSTKWISREVKLFTELNSPIPKRLAATVSKRVVDSSAMLSSVKVTID